MIHLLNFILLVIFIVISLLIVVFLTKVYNLKTSQNKSINSPYSPYPSTTSPSTTSPPYPSTTSPSTTSPPLSLRFLVFLNQLTENNLDESDLSDIAISNQDKFLTIDNTRDLDNTTLTITWESWSGDATQWLSVEQTAQRNKGFISSICFYGLDKRYYFNCGVLCSVISCQSSTNPTCPPENSWVIDLKNNYISFDDKYWTRTPNGLKLQNLNGSDSQKMIIYVYQWGFLQPDQTIPNLSRTHNLPLVKELPPAPPAKPITAWIYNENAILCKTGNGIIQWVPIGDLSPKNVNENFSPIFVTIYNDGSISTSIYYDDKTNSLKASDDQKLNWNIVNDHYIQKTNTKQYLKKQNKDLVLVNGDQSDKNQIMFMYELPANLA